MCLYAKSKLWLRVENVYYKQILALGPPKSDISVDTHVVKK